MKRNVFVISTACLLLVFSSCQKDNIDVVPEVQVQFSNVDPELWSYFASFENEAAKRGFNYDLEAMQIVGIIQEISQENVAGSCKFGSHIHNEVTIDRTFWNRSSNIFKEFVVFHELGHCVLLRDHDESTDGQGRCLSIMRSGTQNCRDSYSLSSRERFIDELFFRN